MNDIRIIQCSECGGDGGFSWPTSFDPFTGNIKESVFECSACGGTGDEEIELQEITLEDLEEMP